MHQPEVDLGHVREIGERGHVPGVVAVDRHRHVDPRDRAVRLAEHAVRPAHHVAEVRRLDEVLLAAVAVAEVEPDLGVLGHRVDVGDEPRDHAVHRVTLPERLRRRVAPALEDRDLDGHVPLDREVPVRDRCADLGDLAEQSVGVRPLERGAVLGAHERRHHGQRRGERDLEAHTGGDRPLLAQAREDRVRGARRVGVAEPPEGHVGRVDPVGETVERPTRDAGRRDEPLGRAEHAGLEGEPVQALPHLAVGDPTETPAEGRRSGAEGALGAAEEAVRPLRRPPPRRRAACRA
ncbi:hypothetical protein [Brachybacterium huguangmaarense]